MSLTKYLKSMKEVEDVREKIKEDFLSVKPDVKSPKTNNNFKITSTSARRDS